MTNTLTQNAALVLGVLSATGAAAVGQDISNSEREMALRYLAETRAGVIESVKGLSDAQFSFKPAPERWSVAETLEHLTIVEEFVATGVRPRLEKAPAPAPERDVKHVDATIIATVPDRSTKFQAPPQIQPNGRWTPAVSLEHFLVSRDQTVEWLKTDTDLRGHSVNHPALGPLDGYQWILAAAGHSKRHTEQIIEVKTDPNFPAH